MRYPDPGVPGVQWQQMDREVRQNVGMALAAGEAAARYDCMKRVYGVGVVAARLQNMRIGRRWGRA